MNPRILHRIYFDDMPPYRDPFRRYLDSWTRELPDYEIMRWNGLNVDLGANEWVRRAHAARSPVFLSEYFRWKALADFGGMYLDADCEILDGQKLHNLIDETYNSAEYDATVGVEDFDNGHPTAQTVIAKPGSDLVRFMVDIYNGPLSSSLWNWREIRGLIGPQLMSLYFMEHGYTDSHGMMVRLNEPKIVARVRILPQEYFSPKFAIDGKYLCHTENTCVYHLFANLNMKWTDEVKDRLRKDPMLYDEYSDFLQKTIEMNDAPSQVGSAVQARTNPLRLVQKSLRRRFGFR